jgi:imidazolonepropionase-like amidohydrolase
VLIEAGRIARVERKASASRPADATVVSGDGLLLIPGLIDSHVHLSLVPGMSAEQAARQPDIVDEYFRQLPLLAHGMWQWGSLDQDLELPDEIKRLLDQIVTKRIGYQPTIEVHFAMSAYFDPHYLDMPAISRVVAAQMLRWFISPDGRAFKQELGGDSAANTTVLAAFDRGPFRRERQVVAYLAAKDANFLFGTDTPAMPSYGNLPGLNGYLEMRQLQQAGMSLAQIFKAATLGNARAVKLAAQIGTIEPGKIAI